MKQGIIAIAGSAAVAFAIFITDSAIPLWGLVLVAFMLDASNDKKETESDN